MYRSRILKLVQSHWLMTMRHQYLFCIVMYNFYQIHHKRTPCQQYFHLLWPSPFPNTLNVTPRQLSFNHFLLLHSQAAQGVTRTLTVIDLSVSSFSASSADISSTPICLEEQRESSFAASFSYPRSRTVGYRHRAMTLAISYHLSIDLYKGCPQGKPQGMCRKQIVLKIWFRDLNMKLESKSIVWATTILYVL